MLSSLGFTYKGKAFFCLTPDVWKIRQRRLFRKHGSEALSRSLAELEQPIVGTTCTKKTVTSSVALMVITVGYMVKYILQQKVFLTNDDTDIVYRRRICFEDG